MKEETSHEPSTPNHAHETAPKPPERASAPKVYLSKRKRELLGWKLRAFDELWQVFALKKGRAEAADAWLDIHGLSPELAAGIIDAAGGEAKARPALIANKQTPKWAQGWLSGRRWEDWEDDCEGAHNRDNASDREVSDDAKASPSRREVESRYRQSISDAIKRFM